MSNFGTSDATASQGSFDASSYVAVATVVEDFEENEVAPSQAVTRQESSNPYAAPLSLAGTANDTCVKHSLPLKKLEMISTLLFCMQITVVLFIVTFGLAICAPGLSFLIFLTMIAGLATWICMVVLAYYSRSLASAIFNGALAFLPLLGLLILLSVYDRSRKLLKDNGYRSGWLRMELDPDAHRQLSMEQARVEQAAVATVVKKERSVVSLTLTYGLIGLLVGMIVLSIIGS